MKPVALWVPFEVTTLDGVVDFYTRQLGLFPVDGWDRGGERGVVLGVPGPAYVELVAPAPSAPAGPRVAFALELPDARAVDSAHATLGGLPPARFPRGHYGFTVRDPAGAPILVWSEQ